MDGPIADAERLAVYILDSNKLKADGAHWRVFTPNPEDGERSLFRTIGLSEVEVANLGQVNLGDLARRPVRGWAELVASDIRQRPPLVVDAAEPPDRHGIIKDWPPEPQKVKALAMDLARLAVTRRWPPG